MHDMGRGVVRVMGKVVLFDPHSSWATSDDTVALGTTRCKVSQR